MEKNKFRKLFKPLLFIGKYRYLKLKNGLNSVICPVYRHKWGYFMEKYQRNPQKRFEQPRKWVCENSVGSGYRQQQHYFSGVWSRQYVTMDGLSTTLVSQIGSWLSGERPKCNSRLARLWRPYFWSFDGYTRRLSCKLIKHQKRRLYIVIG